MRTNSHDAFDAWLRGPFRDGNTALEEAVFAGRAAPDANVLLEGARWVAPLVEAPLPEDPYELLGMVGFWMAACRRHELEADLGGAHVLATRLGSALGVAPRYVFAQQAFHADGRSFTTLPEERAFTELNGLAVLAQQRAAAALRRAATLGPAHIGTAYELRGARQALADALGFCQAITREVSVERFFRNVRPYFKPHAVGAAQFRGTNAGDFSAVNEIDLLLGLASVEDPFYAAILAEKRPYVPPADQAALRDSAAIPSLLTAFLRAPAGPGLRENATLLLAVQRAHGAAATYHHHALVKPFLERPAALAPPEQAADMSASGPPLPVVIAGLERLRDLRVARPRPEQPSARAALDALRATCDPQVAATTR